MRERRKRAFGLTSRGAAVAALAAGILLAGWAPRASAQSGLLGGLGGSLLAPVNNLLNEALQLLGAPGTTPPTRLIVSDSNGLLGLQQTCSLLGCAVTESLDGSGNSLFLISRGNLLSPVDFLLQLLQSPGVLDVEVDLPLHLQQSAAPTPPSALFDEAPVSYFGATVWRGYLTQPAAEIVQLPEEQSAFGDAGAGIVADIDTGVDPTHPALQAVLLPGYDFTRNQAGGSEMGDLDQRSMAVVNQRSMAVVNGDGPVMVNQYAMAVVNSEDAETLNSPQLADFGHGTMTAGVIHLVAPQAKILPLKAFNADGSGYLSDVIRAVYYAVDHHANVINMSFDLPTPSFALATALRFANLNQVVCVASAGNDGENTTVFPAGYAGLVMGVASVSNDEQLSSFSNYGWDVFVAAPGEGVVTTYPFGQYAAGWGTSFSAPFVSGAAALLYGARGGVFNQQDAQAAIAAATPGASNLGHGVVNLHDAVTQWQSAPPPSPWSWLW